MKITSIVLTHILVLSFITFAMAQDVENAGFTFEVNLAMLDGGGYRPTDLNNRLSVFDFRDTVSLYSSTRNNPELQIKYIAPLAKELKYYLGLHFGVRQISISSILDLFNKIDKNK